MSRLRSSSTASLSAPGRTSGRGRSRPSSRSRSPAPPAARSRTRLRVSKPGCAEYTRPQVRQLPGGVSPPVAASSVAPIVELSGLPASLPRTPSHSPDKPLNLRPDVLAFRGEIDHDVCDRAREALARLLDEALLEPVRAADGMCRDDNLVGAERAQRILDRLEGIAVADLAADVEAGLSEVAYRRLYALLGRCARPVLVRKPVAERRVEGRGNDEDLDVAAPRAPDQLLAQHAPSDRLVRDHEDPVPGVLVLMHHHGRPTRRGLVPVPPRDRAYRDGCNGDTEPCVCARGADDQRGADDDDAEKAKGVSLGAQRVSHLRGCKPSCRPLSTLRRRSASRFRRSRPRGGARARNARGRPGSS